MFKSIIYKKYNGRIKKFIYELTDSEFGICKIEFDRNYNISVMEGDMLRSLAVAQEYQKRNLPIAENMALFHIWYHNRPSLYPCSFEQLKQWQDKYCPEYINDWSEISKQIDILIKKYQLLQ